MPGEPDLPMTVTPHAELRCRKRFGLRRRAVLRAARDAWRHGMRIKSTLAYPDSCMIWRGNACFVFSREPQRVVLITVMRVAAHGSRSGRQRGWA